MEGGREGGWKAAGLGSSSQSPPAGQWPEVLEDGLQLGHWDLLTQRRKVGLTEMVPWLVGGGEAGPSLQERRRSDVWPCEWGTLSGQPLVLGSGHPGHFWCPPTSWSLQGTAVRPLLWPCGSESLWKPGNLNGPLSGAASSHKSESRPSDGFRLALWRLVGVGAVLRAGAGSCLSSQPGGYLYFRQK